MYPRCLSGGFLDSLLNKRSGQETEPRGIADSLENLGAANEEADYYQREAEADRSIIAGRPYRHQQETQIQNMARHSLPAVVRIPGTARHSTRIPPIALLEAPEGGCL